MQQFPTTQQIRRDQIGGALVTNLSDVILSVAQSQVVDPVLVAAVIRHEGSAIERRVFTLSPSSVPGSTANFTEYTQTLLQGDTASIGVGQMQVRCARELEELGYVTSTASEHERKQALLDPVRSVNYVAGMLHYLSDRLQTLPGFTNLSQEDQARLILVGYNQGWETLQYNINEFGFEALINRVGYDNQTLDEYLRRSEDQ